MTTHIDYGLAKLSSDFHLMRDGSFEASMTIKNDTYFVYLFPPFSSSNVSGQFMFKLWNLKTNETYSSPLAANHEFITVLAQNLDTISSKLLEMLKFNEIL